jgi:hypothetical protein
MDDNERCLKECLPFPKWQQNATPAELAEMRLLVIELITSVHAFGICHRDLHQNNLVLDDRRPLVIDLELACEVDPESPCYDLYGPSDTVPVPEQHVVVGGGYEVHGVWWDSPMDGLHRIFGPLGGSP